MPWVRFTADFDFKPIKVQTTAYLADMVANFTTRCAADAATIRAAILHGLSDVLPSWPVPPVAKSAVLA